MNNSSMDIQVTLTARGVITSYQYTIIAGTFSVAWMILSTVGFLGNLINVQTFIAMRLEDGFTVSFLVLSVSDLCFTLTMFLRAAASFFFWIDPYTMYIFFANFCIVLYIMTVLTTTFLAVARCMCVVRPLHFRNSFTRSRCIFILSCFALFTIISYMPILANMAFKTQFDIRTNIFRPMLWTSKSRELVKDIVWGARDAFIPASTQIIVIAYVFVMANSLRESNKFRLLSTSLPVTDRMDPSINNQSSKEYQEKLATTDTAMKVLSRINDNFIKPTDTNKLSRKDVQVVKQVALISVVYIVCNMPEIMVNIAGIIEPELTINNRLHNMYLVSVSLTEFFQMFNSSINVYIYYKYNSKFRSCCPLGKTYCYVCCASEKVDK
ncbi:unnamed protein product [Candidula unifasciata]|uniref:G-protein coupled receptors family 1 profile domain-containing protein n=1 Tax=Candidula unifasciata TaxID=100452 RepID=A0A8S4A291_9EUPU|nr:unnamed protein product [Candidula unifasciata]